ncbi:hypothetical protein DQ04_05541010 [Trypanosoma grayi]|uniref:hypothetical protein n=1 Tax=Trypanosoma grayi TaxID=71804 RepID=UPI0004F47806|nr:hypothetical protein DQ04_05541010 [Trypanosoma grayi]KEG09246.1 hypothetical protein DQ04_05541010 [Trypanosoma grayi]
MTYIPSPTAPMRLMEYNMQRAAVRQVAYQAMAQREQMMYHAMLEHHGHHGGGMGMPIPDYGGPSRPSGPMLEGGGMYLEGSYAGDMQQQQGSFSGGMQQQGPYGGDMQRQGSFGGDMQQQGSFGGDMQQQGSFGGDMQRQGSFGGDMQQQGSFGGDMQQQGSSTNNMYGG